MDHPGALCRASQKVMAEMGATLEDAGYLDEPDDEPDPDPAAIGTVISIDGDPAVTDWQQVIFDEMRGRKVA